MSDTQTIKADGCRGCPFAAWEDEALDCDGRPYAGTGPEHCRAVPDEYGHQNGRWLGGRDRPGVPEWCPLPVTVERPS